MPTKPTPLYDPAKAPCAYALRWAWSAWIAEGHQWPANVSELVHGLREPWESDGLRALEHRTVDDLIQVVFSARPHVSPVLLAARAKGRLDHTFREAHTPLAFTRKVAVRSLGDNARAAVENYIAQQVRKAGFLDARWAAQLQELVIENQAIDLSLPQESARGRYWSCLQVVLVTEGRLPFEQIGTLRRIREGCARIAEKKAFLLSRLAVMPDHLHLAMGVPPEMSPVEVVHTLQNNLAYLLGQRRVWRDSYYVGTFGDYDMNAVRRGGGAERD